MDTHSTLLVYIYMYLLSSKTPIRSCKPFDVINEAGITAKIDRQLTTEGRLIGTLLTIIGLENLKHNGTKDLNMVTNTYVVRTLGYA